MLHNHIGIRNCCCFYTYMTMYTCTCLMYNKLDGKYKKAYSYVHVQNAITFCCSTIFILFFLM